MKKLLAIFLCLCLLSVPAFASGEASGGSSEGGPMPNMAAGAGSAAYTVGENGLETDSSLVSIERAPGAAESETELSGLRISSDDNLAGGIEYTGKGDLRIGGEKDNFTVTTVYTGEELSFNTVIDSTSAGLMLDSDPS